MKKLLICLITLALITGFGLTKAEAATSDEIAVTVTLQNISVSVTPDDWAIGTVAPSSVNTQACTATNNGNVNEDLDIAVTDSTNWTAGASAGSDIFAMDFSLTGAAPWTNITTGGVVLVNALAPGDQTFTLQFTAPDPGSVYTQQSITVTVSASP